MTPQPNREPCFAFIRPRGRDSLANCPTGELAKSLARLVKNRLQSRIARGVPQSVERDGSTVSIVDEGTSVASARLQHPERYLLNGERPRKLVAYLWSDDGTAEFTADLRDVEPMLRRAADWLCWASLDPDARERRRSPVWAYLIALESFHLDADTLSALSAAAERYCQN
jgi:hypothetical protein